MIPQRRNDRHSKEIRVSIPKWWRNYYTRKLRRKLLEEDLPSGGFYKRNEHYWDYDPWW